MQAGTDFIILSGIMTIILSLAMSTFLGWKWYKQKVRLMTDLPLVFSITGLFQVLNMLLLTLPNIGVLEPSLELFRIRSLVIGGAIIPIMAAILQIWMPSYQKYHKRTIFFATLYWFAIALLGPSEAFIMTLTIPIILIISVVMMVTFIVTWKTGRLKEIRSELLIVSSIFMMASQILRVPLMLTSLFYVPDIFLGVAMVLIAIGIANPWYAREKKKQSRESQEVAPYLA
ncbi:MAG: hypothetical protein ACFFEV_02320 [Candidatus Thorarchaeota archaeon]